MGVCLFMAKMVCVARLWAWAMHFCRDVKIFRNKEWGQFLNDRLGLNLPWSDLVYYARMEINGQSSWIDRKSKVVRRKLRDHREKKTLSQ